MTLKIAVVVALASLIAFLLWPQGHGLTRADHLFLEGETLREKALYQDAITKYKDALARAEKDEEDISFVTFIKFRIAVCYVYLGDQEGDVVSYAKAEQIVEDVYPAASIHKERILYLWGYILLKEARYEEAHAKFEELLGNFSEGFFAEAAWYALGKASLELGDEGAARQAFQQLLEKFPHSEYKDKPEVQRLLKQ